LILMHCVLEMGIGADPHLLRRFAPIFVEAVERWRKRSKDISEGREPTDTMPVRPPMPGGGVGGGPGGQGGQGQHPGMPGRPGQPFTKV
jgi:hypothetical protein